MNNLYKIFNKNILRAIDSLSRGEFYLRGIASSLKISPSAAHAIIKKLLKLKFVTISKQQNKRIITLNTDNLFLQKIKSLINLDKILSSRAYRELCKLGAASIYGSFSEGKNDKHSDLDLWVYGEKVDPVKVSKVASLFEKELKVETNILVLNKNKLERLKKNDPEFYTRLKFTSVPKREEIFD